MPAGFIIRALGSQLSSGLTSSVLAVGIGAALGALLRWLLGLSLNALWPTLPPGTLLANLLGGYLIGVAMAVFAQHPQITPAWRLFIVTGFLGGLTTFSTFSAEVAVLLQAGRPWAAGTAMLTHGIGSVAMTLLGWASHSAWPRS